MVKIQKLNESIMDHHMKMDKLTYEESLTSTIVDEGIRKVEKFYEDYISLNEASLQSLHLLLLNKTFYIVQQISNDLMLINPNRIIKKRRKQNNTHQKVKSRMNKIPKYWLKNVNLLNQYNILQLELYQYTLELRDDMHGLVTGVKEKIENLVLKHFINAVRLFASFESKSSDIKKISGYLTVEQFEFLWKEYTEPIIKKILSRSAMLPKSMEIMNHDVFENFKTEQYSGHKSQTIQLRDMADYYIRNDFVGPLTSNLDETKDKVIQSIEEVLQLINTAYTHKMNGPAMESEKNYDLTAEEIEGRLKFQVQQIEKLATRITNQILERRNALSDKFSLLNIMRYDQSVKKFIKR
jgi:hypothetical protein